MRLGIVFMTLSNRLTGFVICAISLTLQGQALAHNPIRPPNIFLIFSDDVTKRDLGCYGNKAVRTPRLDRLAKEGMLFNQVFTASPSCAPSRASLYTGLYPFRNGVHPNHSEVKPGTKSLAHYMAALGYRVVL